MEFLFLVFTSNVNTIFVLKYTKIKSVYRRVELARTAVIDKLYVSPAVETVNWANESGYQAFLYIHKLKVHISSISVNIEEKKKIEFSSKFNFFF